MTHKAKSPDGFDTTKINKSDGGAGVTLQRDGWFDTVTEGVCVRTVQKMQSEAGVQLFYSKSERKVLHEVTGRVIFWTDLKSDVCQLQGAHRDPSVTCCLYRTTFYRMKLILRVKSYGYQRL